MGIPVMETKQEFNLYAAGVENRLHYRRPYAFGIGAVRYINSNSFTEIVFPKINIEENFGSAAAFADVTHHRFGNAVRPLGFWELKEIEGLFEPFLAEPGHGNVDAYKEVRRLVGQHGMSGVVVFAQHLDDDTCHDNPVYMEFLKQLQLQLVDRAQLCFTLN